MHISKTNEHKYILMLIRPFTKVFYPNVKKKTHLFLKIKLF